MSSDEMQNCENYLRKKQDVLRKNEIRLTPAGFLRTLASRLQGDIL